MRRAAGLADCEQTGAVDYATTDLLAAVSNADLVILCTPLAQMRALAEAILPALKRSAIVTDVGSVKAGVVRDLEALIQKTGAHFVGSHPMAGGEKMGVRAARADLYHNAVCIVTPTKNSHAAAVRQLEQFWQALGSRTMRLAAAEHDLLVSRTSHLPHVAAAALAGLVLNPKHSPLQTGLCASGFRDTTRVASGSPEMWRDIALANRKNVARSVEALMAELKKFQTALKSGRPAAVEKFFATAKTRRDNWCADSTANPPE